MINIRKLRQWLSVKTVQSWLWLAALLTVWEVSSRLGWINNFLLPPFSQVVLNSIKQILMGDLGRQTFNSLLIIIEGIAISLVGAVIVSLLSSWLTPIETLFTTLSTVFDPLPAIALMPLIILWFGISTGAILTIVVHSVFWSLVRHLLDGIRAIPKVYYEWCDNIELSPLRKFSGMMFYAVLPELIVGVRMGWGRAWRALLSAEMVFGVIGSLGGIGYYIYNARAYSNITNVMSGVVIIVIVGIIIESFLFTQLEKYTIRRWGMIRE